LAFLKPGGSFQTNKVRTGIVCRSADDARVGADNGFIPIVQDTGTFCAAMFFAAFA
jgi:hypothetical protein